MPRRASAIFAAASYLLSAIAEDFIQGGKMIAHVAQHVLLHRRRQLDQFARVCLAGANSCGKNSSAARWMRAMILFPFWAVLWSDGVVSPPIEINNQCKSFS